MIIIFRQQFKVLTFDYGMWDKNPIDFMRFYRKGNFDQAIEVEKQDVGASFIN